MAGATNCWPSLTSANPGQNAIAARSAAMVGAVSPSAAMPIPATAATPAPGQIRLRRAAIRYPAPAVTTTASQQTAAGPP